MENGSHHAGRITVIETGSADWDRYQRELAMAPTTHDEPEHAAQPGGESVSPGASLGTRQSQGEAAVPSNATETPATGSRNEELPRTASNQPLLLGLGLSAAAMGLGLAILGRRRPA